MRAFILIVLLLPLIASAQSFKVMTYNIRYDNPGDGVNSWSNRKTKVFELIKKYNPDIFGVQEALHHQLEDIENALPDYEYFGAGRDDGKEKGEYSAIFIRKNRFDVVDQNTFWLSETPSVPGSKNWDAAITRVATWGKLRDEKSKREFLLINTHFDHVGKEARKHSAAILADSAASMSGDLPVVITGDFNFKRTDPPYEVIMDPSKIELVDPAGENPPGTSCGFAVKSDRGCNGIDYIFHTPEWKATDYKVIQDNDGTHYPSDHLPVIVTLSLKKNK